MSSALSWSQHIVFRVMSSENLRGETIMLLSVTNLECFWFLSKTLGDQKPVGHLSCPLRIKVHKTQQSECTALLCVVA